MNEAGEQDKGRDPQVLRRGGAERALQRAANRFVKKMVENEQDPILRCAAKAARDLTIEKYRMQ